MVNIVDKYKVAIPTAVCFISVLSGSIAAMQDAIYSTETRDARKKAIRAGT